MSFDKKPINVWIRSFFGIVLATAGAIGFWYAIRTARSQIRYQRIKFREPDITLAAAVQEAEIVHALYPHNYHLSRWLAEKAWYEHSDGDLALIWVRKGVAQNPHHLEMRWLETVLIGMEDPAAAARMWEAYSDEVFWNRWVLAGRVYWLAYAGRIEEAEHYMQILRRIGGDHRWAEDALAAAKIL
ncbi:MAG: hypothetical protein ACNA71_01930 [Kiritimatiellia bacterium]